MMIAQRRRAKTPSIRYKRRVGLDARATAAERYEYNHKAGERRLMEKRQKLQKVLTRSLAADTIEMQYEVLNEHNNELGERIQSSLESNQRGPELLFMLDDGTKRVSRNRIRPLVPIAQSELKRQIDQIAAQVADDRFGVEDAHGKRVNRQQRANEKNEQDARTATTSNKQAKRVLQTQLNRGAEAIRHSNSDLARVSLKELRRLEGNRTVFVTPEHMRDAIAFVRNAKLPWHVEQRKPVRNDGAVAIQRAQLADTRGKIKKVENEVNSQLPADEPHVKNKKTNNQKPAKKNDAPVTAQSLRQQELRERRVRMAEVADVNCLYLLLIYFGLSDTVMTWIYPFVFVAGALIEEYYKQPTAWRPMGPHTLEETATLELVYLMVPLITSMSIAFIEEALISGIRLHSARRNPNHRGAWTECIRQINSSNFAVRMLLHFFFSLFDYGIILHLAYNYACGYQPHRAGVFSGVLDKIAVVGFACGEELLRNICEPIGALISIGEVMLNYEPWKYGSLATVNHCRRCERLCDNRPQDARVVDASTYKDLLYGPTNIPWLCTCKHKCTHCLTNSYWRCCCGLPVAARDLWYPFKLILLLVLPTFGWSLQQRMLVHVCMNICSAGVRCSIVEAIASCLRRSTNPVCRLLFGFECQVEEEDQYDILVECGGHSYADGEVPCTRLVLYFIDGVQVLCDSWWSYLRLCFIAHERHTLILTREVTENAEDVRPNAVKDAVSALHVSQLRLGSIERQWWTGWSYRDLKAKMTGVFNVNMLNEVGTPSSDNPYSTTTNDLERQMRRTAVNNRLIDNAFTANAIQMIQAAKQRNNLNRPGPSLMSSSTHFESAIFITICVYQLLTALLSTVCVILLGHNSRRAASHLSHRTLSTTLCRYTSLQIRVTPLRLSTEPPNECVLPRRISTKGNEPNSQDLLLRALGDSNSSGQQKTSHLIHGPQTTDMESVTTTISEKCCRHLKLCSNVIRNTLHLSSVNFTPLQNTPDSSLPTGISSNASSLPLWLVWMKSFTTHCQVLSSILTRLPELLSSQWFLVAVVWLRLISLAWNITTDLHSHGLYMLPFNMFSHALTFLHWYACSFVIYFLALMSWTLVTVLRALGPPSCLEPLGRLWQMVCSMRCFAATSLQSSVIPHPWSMQSSMDELPESTKAMMQCSLFHMNSIEIALNHSQHVLARGSNLNGTLTIDQRNFARSLCHDLGLLKLSAIRFDSSIGFLSTVRLMPYGAEVLELLFSVHGPCLHSIFMGQVQLSPSWRQQSYDERAHTLRNLIIQHYAQACASTCSTQQEANDILKICDLFDQGYRWTTDRRLQMCSECQSSNSVNSKTSLSHMVLVKTCGCQCTTSSKTITATQDSLDKEHNKVDTQNAQTMPKSSSPTAGGAAISRTQSLKNHDGDVESQSLEKVCDTRKPSAESGKFI